MLPLRWLWCCLVLALSSLPLFLFLCRRVKRAIHRESRRVFAIKIMEKESIIQSKVNKQVRKEVCTPAVRPLVPFVGQSCSAARRPIF